MYRILLVEDDAALADAITQVLTAWGHEVQKVRDFRHVTEEFAEWKPQIVLMDLMLPFFNGHHWTPELRRVTSVPIVDLSCRLRAISSPAGMPCWIWTVQPSPSMGRASP